jgi:hypothetical protein
MGLRERTPPTPEQYAEYRTRFSNWGRWGDDDEFGTLNFVTAEVRRAAARLVREGRAISCSRPIDTHSGPANPYPARHLVAVRDSGEMADFLSMFVHGFADTHLDALCHLATVDGDVTWNGKPLDGYHMPVGHSGTIDFWRDGIVTRGVLYDIPRLRGTACVESGAPVTPAEVDLGALRALAFQAARRLSLDIFGGDVVIDPSRRPVLIDLNDWPSFAPIRDRAARAIAGHVHAARPRGALA